MVHQTKLSRNRLCLTSLQGTVTHLGALSYKTVACSCSTLQHLPTALIGRHFLKGGRLVQGFAYVKYNNSISAASAVERYNGFELPAGSGLRLKVRALLHCCMSNASACRS